VRGRKIAVFDQYCHLSWKWYDIGPQFLLIAVTIMINNRNSQVPSRTMSLLMTLKGGLEGQVIWMDPVHMLSSFGWQQPNLAC